MWMNVGSDAVKPIGAGTVGTAQRMHDGALYGDLFGRFRCIHGVRGTVRVNECLSEPVKPTQLVAESFGGHPHGAGGFRAPGATKQLRTHGLGDIETHQVPRLVGAGASRP